MVGFVISFSMSYDGVISGKLDVLGRKVIVGAISDIRDCDGFNVVGSTIVEDFISANRTFEVATVNKK